MELACVVQRRIAPVIRTYGWMKNAAHDVFYISHSLTSRSLTTEEKREPRWFTAVKATGIFMEVDLDN
jgi:hypothetical protein